MNENYAGSGTPLNFQFASETTPPNFFVTNYASLSTTNRTFKIVMTLNTASCSNSSFGYFRIAAGNVLWTPEQTEDPFIESISLGKSSNLNVNIYPNPSDGIYNIYISNIIEDSYIEIFDVLGNKMLTKRNLYENSKIDLSNFSNGLFYYTVHSGNEKLNGKLIKN